MLMTFLSFLKPFLKNNFYHFSGCESETDTEEFEKVGQSPVDRRKLADGRIEVIAPKPESAEMATSTHQVETVSTETLTEVGLIYFFSLTMSELN